MTKTSSRTDTRHDDTAKSTDGSASPTPSRATAQSVILVAGAFCHRSFGPMQKIAEQLLDEYAVVT